MFDGCSVVWCCLVCLSIKLQQATLDEARLEQDQLEVEKESMLDQIMEKVQCCAQLGGHG